MGGRLSIHRPLLLCSCNVEHNVVLVGIVEVAAINLVPGHIELDFRGVVSRHTLGVAEEHA